MERLCGPIVTTNRVSVQVFLPLVPEHCDELWGEQLWPQSFDLSHVSQKTQHIAMKLLLVWKLLQTEIIQHEMKIFRNDGTAKFSMTIAELYSQVIIVSPQIHSVFTGEDKF